MNKPVTIIFMIMTLFFKSAVADIELIEEKEPNKRMSDFSHILISGEINTNDPEKLQSIIEKLKIKLKTINAPDNMLVSLDSNGGSVYAAIKMGEILRNSLAHTFVDGGSSCSSSCIFLLAGGVMRNIFLDGELGLHRPRFDYNEYANFSSENAKNAYDALIEQCSSYMKRMGIKDDVFNDMLKIPSQEIKFVNRDYAEMYNLVGVDPGWEEWSRAKDIKSKGIDRVKTFDDLISCYNTGENKNFCEMDYKRKLKELDY